MWLRRLVGLVMIFTCIGLNLLTLAGIVLPDKAHQVAVQAQQQAAAVEAPLPEAPSVVLKATPSSIAAGSSSGLTWSTTGDPGCIATGSWSGGKTAFGSESTGRIGTPGNYTYTLTCTNPGGKSVATAVVTVGNAPAPAKTNTTVTTTTNAGPRYCGGRLPCYGPNQVAAHGVAGNCWGWNGDRVVNISGFDAAYHVAKSGISSIQTSQICGHDLAPSLNGEQSAGGKTRVHNQTTKNNSDANEIPYFVGYFDASKP